MLGCINYRVRNKSLGVRLRLRNKSLDIRLRLRNKSLDVRLRREIIGKYRKIISNIYLGIIGINTLELLVILFSVNITFGQLMALSAN